ncbi:MAG TPA: SDR family NAD(P)-dependent oxidoreductase [Planctomycetaceae bacterium]|nr:SDR family NAD(P)-dependent oxidoreductase [Planctomycetaceae bacterium]
MAIPPSVPKKLTVIITGASAGLGRRICQRLGAKQFRLVLAARSVEKLAQLEAELVATGCECISVPTDVADPNALEALVKATMDRFGRIDVLINNAGIECFAEFDQLPLDQILATIETNLTGTIVLTRHVVPIMRTQGFGRIINMASTAGKHGPAFGAVYGATKAGLIAFTQGLRGELLSVGITATAICPGFATDGGVYDEIIKATGRKAPFFVGGTNADKVATAVEKAIRCGPPEMILNFPAMRPVFLFRDFFPRLGEKLILASTFKFLRRVATAHKETSK